MNAGKRRLAQLTSFRLVIEACQVFSVILYTIRNPEIPSKIACISGNRRPDNFTAKALAVVTVALESRGAEVATIDGRELDLAFPGDPQTADSKQLKLDIAAADAIVFATPEYHGTFSAYAKLIIENLGFPSALQGKPVALLGVAGGRIGAIKSLVMAIMVFGTAIGPGLTAALIDLGIVFPDQMLGIAVYFGIAIALAAFGVARARPSLARTSQVDVVGS